MGPVTNEEYESRAERYDKELLEQVEIQPQGLATKQKVAAIRKYREDRYEKLVDAVYKRRGWDGQGIPTINTLQRLGIDFPDVVRLVETKHHE
jgi:aldehyde:ferredoxin oxidoreductase